MARKLAAEAIGTFFLLAIVVGSGIMGDRLSNGTAGIALLANSLATGAGWAVLILVFSRISGAHFNPLISIASVLHGRMSRTEFAQYLAAQLIGAFCGVMAAHLMFGEIYLSFSGHVRSGWPGVLSEFIATFGLIAVYRGVGFSNSRQSLPYAVGLYIMSAYWFTSSNSFANPVVTLARAFTPTFAGIRPIDAPGFCIAQVCGAVAAEFVFDWFDVRVRRREKEE